MRKAIKLIGIVAAVTLLVGASVDTFAQGEDDTAPAAVLGWALDESLSAEGVSGEVGDMFVRAGIAYTYRFDATDPRLSGDALWTGTGHRFQAEPMFEVQSSTWQISNDAGGWSGTATAIVGNGLGDTDTIVLTGTGGYEGLSAYLLMTWSRSGGNFRGAIFPGGMPPAP